MQHQSSNERTSEALPEETASKREIGAFTVQRLDQGADVRSSMLPVGIERHYGGGTTLQRIAYSGLKRGTLSEIDGRCADHSPIRCSVKGCAIGCSGSHN